MTHERTSGATAGGGLTLPYPWWASKAISKPRLGGILVPQEGIACGAVDRAKCGASIGRVPCRSPVCLDFLAIGSVRKRAVHPAKAPQPNTSVTWTDSARRWTIGSRPAFLSRQPETRFRKVMSSHRV